MNFLISLFDSLSWFLFMAVLPKNRNFPIHTARKASQGNLSSYRRRKNQTAFLSSTEKQRRRRRKCIQREQQKKNVYLVVFFLLFFSFLWRKKKIWQSTDLCLCVCVFVWISYFPFSASIFTRLNIWVVYAIVINLGDGSFLVLFWQWNEQFWLKMSVRVFWALDKVFLKFFTAR